MRYLALLCAVGGGAIGYLQESAASVGPVRIVARSWEPAPGTGGSAFREFMPPVIDGRGEVAFTAHPNVDPVNPGSGFAPGIWRSSPTGNSMVLRYTTPLADGSGDTCGLIHESVLGSSGSLAVRSLVDTSGPVSGFQAIFRSDPDGAFSRVMQAGEVFTFNGSSYPLRGFNSELRMGNARQVLVSASFDRPNVPGQAVNGYVRDLPTGSSRGGAAGTKSALAIQYATAAGAADGALLDTVQTMALAPDGRIGYSARLTNIPGVLGNNGTYVEGTDGQMREVARRNAPVPGLFGGQPITNAGEVLFNSAGNHTIAVARSSTSVRGEANADGTYTPWPSGDGLKQLEYGLGPMLQTSPVRRIVATDAAGVYQPILVNGAAVPGPQDGLPAGTLVSLASTGNVNDYPIAFNHRGDMAMVAKLSGPGLDPGTPDALFGYTHDTGAFLMARGGELFEVAPGDLRTISRIDLLDTITASRRVAIGQGESVAMNEVGQVAALLYFYNPLTHEQLGSAVAVFTVPGPSAIWIPGVAAVGILRRRTRIA